MYMSKIPPKFGRLQVIDSHTGGEPTRVVLSGGPDLGKGSLADRLRLFRAHHDRLRTSVVLEPRGSEVIVGALLSEPVDPRHAAGVIFFNDAGYLGMCGHGTIGLVTTLHHAGRIAPGKHVIETPVGTVRTELHADGSVSVQNVASYRYRENVTVETPGYGRFSGDVAWAGNWFFLVSGHGYKLDLANKRELVTLTTAIRAALTATNITGENGALIDHIELFSAPEDAENSSRNFVLCPGASFDRSPCGTGTSAKMACLYAAGRLKVGDLWRQEGILGSIFTGSVEIVGEAILPTITGKAWITAESTLLFDPSDPFLGGFAV
jgi:4-hydroxyproline epimerase